MYQGQDPVLFRVRKRPPSWWPLAALTKAMAGVRKVSRRERRVSCSPWTAPGGSEQEGKAGDASQSGNGGSVHMRCGHTQEGRWHGEGWEGGPMDDLEKAAAGGAGHSGASGFQKAELGAGCFCGRRTPLVLISCIPTPLPHTAFRPTPNQSQGLTNENSRTDRGQEGRSGPQGVASSSLVWAQGGQLYEPWGATRGVGKGTIEAALQQVHVVQHAVHPAVLLAVSSLVRKGFTLMDQYRTRYENVAPSGTPFIPLAQPSALILKRE